jgi:hypothetical protein
MRFSSLPQSIQTRTPPPAPPAPHHRAEFYREEFVRHLACLEQQRECFSERAIADVECALAKILAHLDQLCGCEDVDRQVADWLRRLDAVTRASAWVDPRTRH